MSSPPIYFCSSSVPLPGSQVVLTGKIFEYLAAQKPILALVPSGAAADLVLEANAGWVVPPDDIPAIADRLVQVYDLCAPGALADRCPTRDDQALRTSRTD